MFICKSSNVLFVFYFQILLCLLFVNSITLFIFELRDTKFRNINLFLNLKTLKQQILRFKPYGMVSNFWLNDFWNILRNLTKVHYWVRTFVFYYNLWLLVFILSLLIIYLWVLFFIRFHWNLFYGSDFFLKVFVYIRIKCSSMNHWILCCLCAW